jgi:hypothetical protein
MFGYRRRTDMAKRVVIAELGLEGGGATILGTRVDDRWSFWHKGSSLVLDEDDGEEWRGWASERSADLGAVVPDIWPLMVPIAVHPDFVGWFRDQYAAARAGLTEGARECQAGYPEWQWQRVFTGPQEAEPGGAFLSRSPADTAAAPPTADG